MPSGDWDDSDGEDGSVTTQSTPAKVPLAPAAAAIIKETSIDQNSVVEEKLPSDESDEDIDEEGSIAARSYATSMDVDDYETASILEVLDFSLITPDEALSKFTFTHENILAEFADVEIFLISLDSLLIELCSHWYHNWQLGGQTVVLAAQLDRFLDQLTALGGKFKLVWFSDLLPIYEKDLVLNFLRAFAGAHLSQSAGRNRDVVTFTSAADGKWSQYIADLTPSILMISIDNLGKDFPTNYRDEMDFRSKFLSIALHALKANVTVVDIAGMAINMCAVHSYVISPKMFDYKHWAIYLGEVWPVAGIRESNVKESADLAGCVNLSQLWARIIADVWLNCKPTDRTESLESLSSAVLLAALISENKGVHRSYLPEKKTGPGLLHDRRLFIEAATRWLRVVDSQYFGSGRVLPYRLQSAFSELHKKLDFSKSLAVDMDDKLLEPPIGQGMKDSLISKCQIFPVESRLVAEFAKNVDEIVRKKAETGTRNKHFEQFRNAHDQWKMNPIEEEFMKKTTEQPVNETVWDVKRKNKQKQVMSRWYAMFAQSLEGRGSSLLVDFSSQRRGFAAPIENLTTAQNGVENVEPKADGGKKKGGKSGGGNKKAPQQNMREKIMEENKKGKEKKLEKGEREQIQFACAQRDSIAYLEILMSKLDLPDSRAICLYEQTIRVARQMDDWGGNEKLEERRKKAVGLVGLMKQLMTTYREYLDKDKMDKIKEIWSQLGFEKNAQRKGAIDDGKLSLGMNMVDYQLAYGGELIDIQSDPQKDWRVTGFHPDAWQREMLNAVDNNQSAVIIAPTSAGKTFVSYYCIEKVLRQSDEDVVVYVSPTKALLNQVCGSVYARFRNKPLAGGRSLFGTYTNEFAENAENCHVLITIPQCLDRILLSSSVETQKWVQRIKYVIFDEVHCISSSAEAHIWEHLLLLIQCPFLALSATIGNANTLHGWLQAAEWDKTALNKEVKLIRYDERYSELELQIQRIPQSVFTHYHQPGESIPPMELDELMPFGVYVPEKLRMFGIPDDQQLTARQILELYRAMAEVDERTKIELEPSAFFGFSQNPEGRVWLSRAKLRELEKELKKRFMHWLEVEPMKMDSVLNKLSGRNVKEQIEYRATPFEQRHVALASIMPLIDDLRARNQLPAICFNDDRRMCERLAMKLSEALETRQREFEESDEFKSKFAIKDEEKLAKEQRRKRDVKAKKKVGGGKKKRGGDGEEGEEADYGRDDDDDRGEEGGDRLAALQMRKKEALLRFKLFGRGKDMDLYKDVTERLSKSKNAQHAKVLLVLFDRGIGFHHQGLSAVERSSVEILFRSGLLAVVFATSTLALGINMPCKTVMFGVDHHDLTPLQFRQMSGRAGRRGFDHSGSVAFMAIPTSKIRRLLTASLSMLRGNVPFTCGFLLRLLNFVDLPHQMALVAATDKNPKFAELAAQKTIDERLRIALTLLENSFAQHTLMKERGEALKNQLKYYAGFSIQLLRWLELLDEQARPAGFAQLASHLHDHEPGNLLFIYLLQRGALHKLCAHLAEKPVELKKRLVLIFAHLFTRRRLPKHWQPEDKKSYPSESDSKIFLDPLPKGKFVTAGKETLTVEYDFEQLIREYNETVDGLFKAFMQQATEQHSLQDEAFCVAGRADSDVSVFSTEPVRPLHGSLAFDSAFVPAFAYPLKDHRGRQIYLNGYAADFWHHQSKRTIEKDNNISDRESWALIHDFSITLEHIAEGLDSVGRSNDKLVEITKELATEYGLVFRKAYGMKQKY